MKFDINGHMTCPLCGQVWQPMLRPGGRMPKGYSICPCCGSDAREKVPANESSKRRKTPA